ncbi:SMC-Scp complex subunit ScpB, partial [Candidatus Poribacteria bacterium]|nr:SMC-Scp complex subunit ScpB [Candidatus Poribacteria bacterium]
MLIIPSNQHEKTSKMHVLLKIIPYGYRNMDLTDAKSIIESVIFAADEPVSVDQLTNLLEELDKGVVLQLIQELQQEYDASKHGFQMV